MAFTFSHIVVAPLIYRLSKAQLPLSALVIGCMLPDLARVIFNSPINHHFSGMFSLNLICGWLFYTVWQVFYRPILYALAEWPIPVRQPFHLSAFLMVSLALLIGNFTHLLWDSFTHLDDRTWFAHQFLAIPVQLAGIDMPMHRFLQYVTSLVVLPLLYFAFRPILSQQRTSRLSRSLNRHQLYLYLCSSSICAAFISIGYILYSDVFPDLSVYAQITLSFKVFALVFFAIFSLICLRLHQHLKALTAISTCDASHK